jgi:L-2-hydroxyglutarate oxidase LhgO
LSTDFDCVVVGAGVVGLAIARQLALSGRTVIVLEKNARIGEETSARNSEVIHAGIYYQTGSLKARLCVRGKALLYSYLHDKALPFNRIGKLIVAVNEAQHSRLEGVAALAKANGVFDLEALGSSELRDLEPDVTGVSALLSPSTGIIDAHSLMLSLQADLEAADGVVALNAKVESLLLQPACVELSVRNDDDLSEIATRIVINAAGLYAGELAGRITGIDVEAPVLHYAKGNYFAYEGRSPFKHLVYPLPVDGGLGIHATLDLAGRLRFGPDVEWCDSIDYSLDSRRAESFYTAIKTYWPGLPDGSLAPAYVGVRPKLSGRGEPARDFEIVDSSASASARLIQLFGIESPGLTAALAIGEYVEEMLMRPV